MFDMSFSELMIIAVIALIVVGPEKMPKIARTAGAFIGRMQRYVADVKEEINRESRFEELKALQQEIAGGVQKTESSIRAQVDDLKDVATPSEISAKKTTKNSTRKPRAKRASNSKTASSKPAAKKSSAKKPVAKKPVVKKAETKKSVARKTAVKTTKANT